MVKNYCAAGWGPGFIMSPRRGLQRRPGRSFGLGRGLFTEGCAAVIPAPIADWYFDFVSPYAWFGFNNLSQLPSGVSLRPRPVLFAALLKHWGQKGPAEITGKRDWTYRQCVWWADRHGIDFQMPAAHPFNPIPYLRLAIALDCQQGAIEQIFRWIWTRGEDAGDASRIEQLCRQLDVDPAQLLSIEIKDALRRSTDEAIRRGVFGVPTLCLGETLFWGSDAMPMVRDYLEDKPVFHSDAMRGASAIPVGVVRKGH